jgi:hypothetical protein
MTLIYLISVLLVKEIIMGKWTQMATYKNFYKYYTYRKSPDHYKYVDREKHKDVLKDLFSEIENMIFEGEVYDIPWGFGEIRINKFKCKNKPRNYKQEKLYFERTGEWKEIYFQNFHTDGYRLKVAWYRRGDQFRNRSFYRFEANRGLKKRFADILRTTGDVSKYMHFNKELSNHLRHTKTLI